MLNLHIDHRVRNRPIVQRRSVALCFFLFSGLIPTDSRAGDIHEQAVTDAFTDIAAGYGAVGQGRAMRPHVPARRNESEEKNPPGFKFDYIESGLVLTQKSQYVTNFLLTSAQTSASSLDVTLKTQGTYGLGFTGSAGRPFITLTGYVREKWAKTTGSRSSYSLDNGAYYPITTLAPPGNWRFLTTQIASELVVPLSSNGLEWFVAPWVGYGLPDLNTSKMTSNYMFAAGVRYNSKANTAKFSIKQRQVAVSEQVPAGPVGFFDYFAYIGDPFDQGASGNTFSGQLNSADIGMTHHWETLSLGGSLGYSSAQPTEGYFMYGEASNMSLGLNASKKLPFGTTTTVSAGRSILSNYKQAVTDPDGAADAPKIEAVGQGTNDRFRAEVTIAPIEWFYVSARFDYAMLEFSAVDPALLTGFNEVSPKNKTAYGLQIGVKKKF